MENSNNSRVIFALPAILGLGLVARHMNPPPRAASAPPQVFVARSAAPAATEAAESSSQAQLSARDAAYDPGPGLDRMLLSVPKELAGNTESKAGGTITAAPPAPPPTAAPPAPPRPQAPGETETTAPPTLPLTAFPQMGPQTAPPPQNVAAPRLTGFQFSSMNIGGGGFSASYAAPGGRRGRRR